VAGFRPSSFDGDYIGEWSEWVLANGLPDLPGRVGVDEAVPVAFWRTGDWAAVLNVQYVAPDPPWEIHASLESELLRFHALGGDWEMANASGGTGWSDDVKLARPLGLGPRGVMCTGSGLSGEVGWACGTLNGVAGTDATAVEVRQGGRRLRQRIDSTIGAWVAAFDATRPAEVRVLSGDSVLFAEELPPADL
jgi:hypothetical protein